MSHENDSNNNTKNSVEGDSAEIDRMSVTSPVGGGFTVSGPNASKLWGKVGWSLIILATGCVIERIASVFLKFFDNGAS